MSAHKIYKVNTAWLDSDDDDKSSSSTSTPTQTTNPPLPANNNLQQDWETIIGTSSDSSTASFVPHSASSILEKTSKSTISLSDSVVMPNAQVRTGNGMSSSSQPENIPFFPPLTYANLGTARLITTRTLLFLRILSIFVLGISAGFSYSLRETIPISVLLREQFPWLHVIFLIIMPCHILCSVMTIRNSHLQGARRPDTQLVWQFVAIVSQAVNTFSLVEAVRLIVLNLVPKLRPDLHDTSTDAIFLFSSSFAVQRYILVAVSILEMSLSTSPHCPAYLLITVVISAAWEVGAFFSRSTTNVFNVRIGILFGSIIATFLLSAMNLAVTVLLNKGMHLSLPKRRMQTEIEDTAIV